MSKYNVLIDTGFWIALYNPAKDPLLSIDAERIKEDIEQENIIIPFPTLYEFVNSRFSRKESVIEFEKLLARPNIELVDDTLYKQEAISRFFERHRYSYSDLSLVDEIIKLILHDSYKRIDYIVTFDSALQSEALSLGIALV